MITITPQAAEKLRESVNANEVRIGVQGGGCSGLQYSFIETKDAPVQEGSDLVFESNGFKIVVDPISLKYLNGSEIDWVGSPIGQFIFKNPNAKGTCGCGQSFDPKE